MERDLEFQPFRPLPFFFNNCERLSSLSLLQRDGHALDVSATRADLLKAAPAPANSFSPLTQDEDSDSSPVTTQLLCDTNTDMNFFLPSQKKRKLIVLLLDEGITISTQQASPRIETRIR